MAGLGPLAANAQPTTEEDRTASVLDLKRPGYEPRKIHLGQVTISPEIDFGALYDSNVYAAPVNPRSDVVLTMRPALRVEEDDGNLRWRGEVFAQARRFTSNPRENSETYGIMGAASVTPRAGVSIAASAGFRRAVENRSDSEVRQNPEEGPPLLDVASGELIVRMGRGKLGVSLKAQAEQYDFVAAADDDRDFTSYRGVLRLLYQVGPAVNGFVQGFVNQRTFRMRDPVSGIDRDSRTLGGLLGVQVDPGGKVRGDIGVGIFRSNPADPQLKNFTGFALEGSLTYVPRARTALIVDVFSGDVATVRSGATGRVDKRARLTVQQEVRHNLLASAGVRYRETRYRGVDEHLTTLGGEAEVEFLMGRHFSLAAVVQASKRTGRDRSDRFERFRVGAEIRYRY